MGVDVVVGGASRDEYAAVVELFDRWERTFSRFRAGSELVRVNACPADSVLVTALFAGVLRAALAAASETGGLVDPTLGVAVEAAGYDRDFTGSLFDERPVGSTAPGCWRCVDLTGRLLSRPPGMRLDLNGVVKGMAVDDALGLLSGPGFVAAGGDLAARGAVVAELPGGGSILVLAGGLATSGTLRRRWMRGGSIQHHLIDPATGRSARTRWEQVTVAAVSCFAADVAAKAAFLLSDDGPGWLDGRGLPGRFIVGDTIVTNAAWRRAHSDAGTAAAA
jgi:FAD:protein FMN transferase